MPGLDVRHAGGVVGEIVRASRTMLRYHGTRLGSEHAAEQLRQPAGRHELGIAV